MRSLTLVALFTRLELVRWLAGRSFVFALVINQAVTPLIGLVVWTTALPTQPHLAAYYVILLFVQLLTVSYENHTFSNAIYEGELADDLLRPYPVVLRLLGENIAIRIWHVVLGIPLLIGILLLVPVHLSATDALLTAPSLVMAAGLRFVFTYTLALTALWTDRAHNVVGLGGSMIFLLGGGAVPLRLMPNSLQPFAAALPFRAMHGLPAEIGSGWLSAPEIAAGYGWQAVWLTALIGVNGLIWRAGLRRYSAVGG